VIALVVYSAVMWLVFNVADYPSDDDLPGDVAEGT